MSKKRPAETGTTRGGPHHARRRRPGQCMLCRQVETSRIRKIPTKEKRLHVHLESVHLVHTLWAVQCSMPRVVV